MPNLATSKAPPKNSPKNFQISRPLPRDFYLREAPLVALDLLGKGLLVRHGRNVLLAEISEVEAYLGSNDPASHSAPGVTKRNWPMFESGGMCYVYRSYGMHWCLNVVTGEKGVGEAVLIRAAKPISGFEIMKKNRGLMKAGPEKCMKLLMTGPGKLTQALAIDLSYNGRHFDEAGFKIIDLGRDFKRSDIVSSPRIGISKATDLPLRFVVRTF